METYADKPEALKKAGVAYATEQIIDLLSSGVDGIHLYAMNRPEVAQKKYLPILKMLEEAVSMNINYNEVLHYLGYKGQKADKNTEELIDECICELSDIAQRKYAYDF